MTTYLSRRGSISLSGSEPFNQQAIWQDDQRGLPRPFMAGFCKMPPRE